MKSPLRLSAALVLAACSLAAAAMPPAEHFFANPAFGTPQLSPDGKYLAVKSSTEGKRDRLMVITLDDRQAKVVAQFKDADIGRFRWVNNERLIYNVTDQSVGERDRRYAPGLYAVNRDGKGFRRLANRSQPLLEDGDLAVEPLPWHTYMMTQDGAQDSDSVYVYDVNMGRPGEPQYIDLLQLDTVTGKTQAVPHPGQGSDWLLDQNGAPRLLDTLADNDNDTTTWYRDAASQQWRQLATKGRYLAQAGDFSPLAFGPDGKLYVVSYAGRDTSALYRYDPATQKMDTQPLVDLDGFDFEGSLIVSNNKLLGARVHSDAWGTVWFDPAMQALQDKIDALLPHTVNLLTPPLRPASPWVLVTSYSARQPHTYQVFNTASGRLAELGSEAPAIDPARMGSKELVYYKARDGLRIPAWLSLPAGAPDKNRPMVVLVHGGPFVRGGDWSWNAETQFLTSRGYAVLEPEFRGSTGYGAAHASAGWKQWGLKMQDDIADGARWAIAQGTADPQRICIAGASYGGYATLMGLINDPDLYRCGIEWAGVTDIHLLYDSGWFSESDLPASWKRFGMPELIGDAVKDAEQLRATSPLLQAARLKQPLLMAYGGADLRVPLVHGEKFYQAVKAGNRNVEWLKYGEEGHGWALPKNRIDFWTRVEKFLDKNIGAR
ncbi:alpha/beta fold hydrolase [Duganella sp. BJB1802]|uniref:S9 family peptidase n=1 Tax=Duganella sp. BJB1802 TaxID=2744575 RepID=UPI001E4CACE5|nr:alpha/beta fold hydrolase [Duganella sp. BJB1802]